MNKLPTISQWWLIMLAFIMLGLFKSAFCLGEKKNSYAAMLFFLPPPPKELRESTRLFRESLIQPVALHAPPREASFTLSGVWKLNYSEERAREPLIHCTNMVSTDMVEWLSVYKANQADRSLLITPRGPLKRLEKDMITDSKAHTLRQGNLRSQIGINVTLDTTG